MQVRRIVSEVRKDPWVIWYYLQGNVKHWLFGGMVKRYVYRMHRCQSCWEHGTCYRCGCDVHKVFLSSKPCIPMWDNQVKNIGEGYPHEKLPFTFKYSGDRVVKAVVPDCGCTSVTVQGPVIRGHLDLGAYPQAKRIQGVTTTTVRKRITVHFDHGDDDTLYVVAMLKDV